MAFGNNALLIVLVIILIITVLLNKHNLMRQILLPCNEKIVIWLFHYGTMVFKSDVSNLRVFLKTVFQKVILLFFLDLVG